LIAFTPKKDIRVVADSWYAAAPEDFFIFRYLMRPSLLQALWQQDGAKHLMQFFKDFKAGKRPKLILCAATQ
jgi:hypothetical protein